ncbi:hypothetical protein KP509_09G066800 [Ceratopteris richardii]|uniref:Uncharacterized protein n=1 Tax=Ceratopteris richardii TaxID=49495 RepID=A0A8T2U7R0_CERRI|nr:hypothetical protein KP509_09G066800 [Ceratopteris richardii]
MNKANVKERPVDASKIFSKGFLNSSYQNKKKDCNHQDLPFMEAENPAHISSIESISDEPPELEDMSHYVASMWQNKKPPAATATIKRTADSTTLNEVRVEELPVDVSKMFKKGFLDSSYQKNKKDCKQQELPFLKAGKQKHNPKIKDIPDILKVKLEDSPRDKARKELMSLLEPTKEIVQDVLDNDIIKAGLADPEVMGAVQDIAGDADSIQKYRSNPKVVSFYSHLGKLMGDKIQLQEKKGSKGDS